MTPNTIQFSSTNNTWVMRITADRRIEVNEDVEVTEAAQKVLDAMQHRLDAQLNLLILAEREACAYRAGIALLGADRGLANRIDQAIRARGNT